MNSRELSRAIRKVKDNVADFQDECRAPDNDDDNVLHDARGLLSVLANIIDGMPVDKAFGSPGDWGYGTPIANSIVSQID